MEADGVKKMSPELHKPYKENEQDQDEDADVKQEPRPSTSKFLCDSDDEAPPLKRRKLSVKTDIERTTSVEVPSPDAESSNPPPINLLADMEQARAVSKWEESFRRKYRGLLEEAKSTMQSLSSSDIQDGEKLAEGVVGNIVGNRCFNGIFGYFGVESLIAAVEIRDNPALMNLPIGVCHKDTLCSVNSLAIDQGVQPEMPIDLAMKLCSNLKVIPSNFDKYNEITLEIKEIVRHYDPQANVSMNYAELNLSSFVGDGDNAVEVLVETKDGGEGVVSEIRRRILEKTGLKTYVGIGPTPLIAKLASLLQRPSGVYVVAPSKKAIDSFLHGLPVTQFCGISEKVESMLRVLEIQTSDQIWKNRGCLPYLVNQRTMQQLMCICLGCTPDFLKLGFILQSDGGDIVTHSKWLYGTRSQKFLNEVCYEICAKIQEKMKVAKVVGKMLTLKLSSPDMEHKKKFCNLETSTNSVDIFMYAASKLIDLLLLEDSEFLISGIRVDITELTVELGSSSNDDDDDDSENDWPPPQVPRPSIPGTNETNASAQTLMEQEGKAPSVVASEEVNDENFCPVKNGNEEGNGSSRIKPAWNKSSKTYTLRCPNCRRGVKSRNLKKAERKMNGHIDRCLIRFHRHMFNYESPEPSYPD